jgi:hypothetical protein
MEKTHEKNAKRAANRKIGNIICLGTIRSDRHALDFGGLKVAHEYITLCIGIATYQIRGIRPKGDETTIR